MVCGQLGLGLGLVMGLYPRLCLWLPLLPSSGSRSPSVFIGLVVIGVEDEDEDEVNVDVVVVVEVGSSGFLATQK